MRGVREVGRGDVVCGGDAQRLAGAAASAAVTVDLAVRGPADEQVHGVVEGDAEHDVRVAGV